MRTGIIDANSKEEQVKEVLIGSYVNEVKDGWKVIRTPWFTCLEKLCQPGTAVLPFAVPVQCEYLWVGKSNHGHVLVKPGQKELVITEASLVRLTYYGE